MFCDVRTTLYEADVFFRNVQFCAAFGASVARITVGCGKVSAECRFDGINPGTPMIPRITAIVCSDAFWRRTRAAEELVFQDDFKGKLGKELDLVREHPRRGDKDHGLE